MNPGRNSGHSNLVVQDAKPLDNTGVSGGGAMSRKPRLASLAPCDQTAAAPPGFAPGSNMTQRIGAEGQPQGERPPSARPGSSYPSILLPGRSEVAFLRSPISHGRIPAHRQPRGRKPGFSSAAISPRGARLAPTTVPKELTKLASAIRWRRNLRFVGDAIAMCVAPTRAESDDLS